MPGRSMGWGAGGGGGVYGHRIVSGARSAGHVALRSCELPGGKSMGPITIRLKRRSRK